MRLAVIPARGGSKRIPRKNIRLFCGKPIIAWTIKAALESGCFDEIIVSTDDKEIADVALQYGATVPFMRPAGLSDDYAGTIPVISHAIESMMRLNYVPEQVCCIYATAPLVQVCDLTAGLELLLSSQWAYVFSVAEYASPIFRSFKQNSDGGIEMFFPEQWHTRSQDLPQAMHDAGQFYWGCSNAWLNNMPIFEKHSFPVKIPIWRVQDIDEADDWKRAELIFQQLMK